MTVRRRPRGVAVALSLAGVLALSAAPPAGAVPTCTGADRSACGGRIIPEATGSAGFLTYAEWTGAMQQLAKEHPDRVRFRQIGKTAGGRPVYDVMVTDFRDPTPLSGRVGLYFNGDIHGDERDGTEGFARTIEDLAETKAPEVLAQLRHEVLVFTDANPDGWQTGDVPEGLAQPGSSGPQYTRENGAGHDLNREWPVVGFQNPTTFPLADPEVRDIVNAHGNGLHRRDGIRFAYGIDVHGSAGAETPPNAQLMLDVLLGADQLDLTRALEQVEMADTYMKNLSDTTNDNVLASVGSATGQRVYRVGDWDTSWDIYGYLVSGGYSDWMANSVTGLGAVTGTVELWLNGEPGQENTFAGFNQQIEASNVHSMRIAVATLMALGMRDQRATLHLPGPVGWVPNRFQLKAGQGGGSAAPVGNASTNPPGRPYPASTNRFWQDLAGDTDHPLRMLDSGAAIPAGEHTVVLTGDPRLDDPAFLARLKSYAAGGGTVVLTDGALRALGGMGMVAPGAVAMQPAYAGYFDIADPSSPLVKGARPLSRQTYEPVPVGYAIDNTFSSSTSAVHSPVWTVDRSAWEGAGGKTAGTTGSGRTSVGELPLGSGRVRIIGALLPDPSGDFAHPFGVSDYAVTYWGYRVLANMLDGTATLGPAPANPLGLPASGGCVDSRKFSFRLHSRRGSRIVRVEVFVNGRRVLVRRGRDIRRVTLKRLPRRTFSVRIVATRRNGSQLESTRTYRGCAKGRPRTRRHHVRRARP